MHNQNVDEGHFNEYIRYTTLWCIRYCSYFSIAHSPITIQYTYIFQTSRIHSISTAPRDYSSTSPGGDSDCDDALPSKDRRHGHTCGFRSCMLKNSRTDQILSSYDSSSTTRRQLRHRFSIDEDCISTSSKKYNFPSFNPIGQYRSGSDALISSEMLTSGFCTQSLEQISNRLHGRKEEEEEGENIGRSRKRRSNLPPMTSSTGPDSSDLSNNNLMSVHPGASGFGNRQRFSERTGNKMQSIMDYNAFENLNTRFHSTPEYAAQRGGYGADYNPPRDINRGRGDMFDVVNGFKIDDAAVRQGDFSEVESPDSSEVFECEDLGRTTMSGMNILHTELRKLHSDIGRHYDHVVLV